MLFLLLLNIISIFFCFYIANKKGANAKLWALIGALFGPFALPFVFFAKARQQS